MKMNNLYQILGCTLALVGIVACGDSILSGRQAAANFEMRAVRGDVVVPTRITLASGITVDSINLGVRRVDIKYPDGVLCADTPFVSGGRVSCEEELESEHGSEHIEARVRLHGPFNFDLIHSTVTPELDAFATPTGMYRKVKIKVDELGSLAPDPAFSDLSLIAEGTFPAGPHTYPWKLRLDLNEDIEIENPTGVEVRDQAVNTLVLNLMINQWFDGLDIGSCLLNGYLTLNAFGELIIDESTVGESECENIKETIVENIEQSMELDRDDD